MERLLLLLFMGVLFFSCSDSSINKESKNTTQNMEQRSLTSMYTDLINSFEDVSAPGLDGVSILYPDYFGGAYVKDDKVVIFLTKESDKDFVKKDLSKRIDLNYVSFVECDYSYAELMDLDKWLFDFFTKNKNKNKIIIKLNDCSSFYINGFKNKVIDTPMIDFEKSRGRLK